ncbi:MAG: hypothetical protein ACE5R7_02395 [Nitrosarchaeum sp.]
MEKPQKQIVIITLFLILTISMTTLFFTLSIQEEQKQLIIDHKQRRVSVLNAIIQEYFSSRIDDAKDIAYNSISTKFLEVDKINPELKGVPEFVEVDQRQELKSYMTVRS